MFVLEADLNYYFVCVVFNCSESDIKAAIQLSLDGVSPGQKSGKLVPCKEPESKFNLVWILSCSCKYSVQ